MNSVLSVPKPEQAGRGVIAIANTKMAFSNIRRGPGIDYQDVGDILDNSLVVYYPQTKTPGKWLWVEKGGLRGWMYTGYVTFIPAVGAERPSRPVKPTPYDGKIAIWHWSGRSIAEDTMEQLLDNIRARTPNVNQIWVKITDGVQWMSEYDSSDLAVHGPGSVDEWVRACRARGLEFHAWCVPHGLDIPGETSIIAAACKRPGVGSLILDIEPHAGYWQGGAENVRPFMMALRRELGARFHIGISVDPRAHHHHRIFPNDWMPFIDSLHPQLYWQTFRITPEEALDNVHEVWQGYGKPIIPVFQGKAPLQEQNEAHTLATQKHGMKGMSWWRYGIISQWTAINRPIELTASPAEPDLEPIDNFADELVIRPKQDGFRSGSYTGAVEFQSRRNTWGWEYLHAPTQVNVSKVWAEWRKPLPHSGLYEISAFVPNRKATTARARYKVHGIVGTDTEVVIDINQHRNRNVWVPLGVFDLDRRQVNAGRVLMNDVTGEPDKEIAFDAIRFRRIVTVTPRPPVVVNDPEPTAPPNPDRNRPDVVDGVHVADGYDSPVGTSKERRSSRIWPPAWRDANPFGKLYFIGTPSEAYHTGADLNFGRPYADKGMKVYACASGAVIFAGSMKVWGNVVIIRHDPLYKPSGAVIYSRYGHVQDIRVEVGQRVARGQRICEIGDAFGRFVPHLHFDMSPTTIFETQPGHWPKTNHALLVRNYIDPLQWIERNRP